MPSGQGTDTTSEFHVAVGDIHPIVNGIVTAADWMSAASFISMTGLIVFYGYGGSVFLMGWTGGYVLLAMLLAPYLRKYGSFIVPEFISDCYSRFASCIIRFLTVPSVKAACESTGWALLFIAILYTTAPAVAIIARLNLMTTIDQPDQAQNLDYADNRPF